MKIIKMLSGCKAYICVHARTDEKQTTLIYYFDITFVYSRSFAYLCTYRVKIVEIERAHVTWISADVTNSNHDSIIIVVDADVLQYFDVTIHVREPVSLE